MSSSSSGPRATYRRSSPGNNHGPQQPLPPPPPPPPPASTGQPGAAIGPSSTSGTRSSSGSSKTSATKKKDQQLSQIEKSVTHLLVATKQLLETLTQWSRQNASETDVSDVYVRLGYEFNIACRAFTSIGVDTTDLGPVPDLLRVILEETLSQEASPASLDRFLPRIRDIIINLLHGLKRKQQRLRAKQAQAKDGASASAGPATGRQQSASSIGSIDSALPGPDEPLPALPPGDKASRRQGSSGSVPEASRAANSEDASQAAAYATSSEIAASREEALERLGGKSLRASGSHSRRSHHGPASLGRSSVSSDGGRSLPLPISDDPPPPLPIQSISGSDGHFAAGLNSAPSPPAPPKQQDALAALQRGGELERRASRRYSAYQISKHLGASPSGVPMIPPPQNSPIPNRGREALESLHAIRNRAPAVTPRHRSSRHYDGSPGRSPQLTSRGATDESRADKAATSEGFRDASEPLVHSQLANVRSSFRDSVDDEPALSATSNGPVADSLAADSVKEQGAEPGLGTAATRQRLAARPTASTDGPGEPAFTPDSSPQPDSELTLFLQYKSKIKKFVLPGGRNDLSLARLQLAFIEKFSWNTHSNGLDLPEIYLQDPVSGVRHEIESMGDIKDRAVLALNVEPLDEVKRHFDEGLGGIRRLVEGLRSTVDGQQLALTQVSERQKETAKDLSKLAVARPVAPATARSTLSGSSPSTTLPPSSAHVDEVQTLRRDLAVMRQTLTGFTSGLSSSMAAIRKKASEVKTTAVVAAVPAFDSDAGRAYVNAGKKTVGDECETIVNRVDDLQDLVEDLRKDVVVRGVRPLPRQLEVVGKDISSATKELKKMQEYVRREKPVWTKIWEKELETVCTDREFLTMQEELITDLEDDLSKATATLALVEQATKQQQQTASGVSGDGSSGGGAGSWRSLTRPAALDIGGASDPVKAKDGVLGEVRALQPNHETRIEAIARAEKARERELNNRQREGAAFKRELSSFVEDSKLRKSGGVVETDRLRRAQDERNIKGEWEQQQERKQARAQARAAEKARQQDGAGDSTSGAKTDLGETIPSADPEASVPASESTTTSAVHAGNTTEAAGTPVRVTSDDHTGPLADVTNGTHQRDISVSDTLGPASASVANPSDRMSADQLTSDQALSKQSTPNSSVVRQSAPNPATRQSGPDISVSRQSGPDLSVTRQSGLDTPGQRQSGADDSTSHPTAPPTPATASSVTDSEALDSPALPRVSAEPPTLDALSHSPSKRSSWLPAIFSG